MENSYYVSNPDKLTKYFLRQSNGIEDIKGINSFNKSITVLPRSTVGKNKKPRNKSSTVTRIAKKTSKRIKRNSVKRKSGAPQKPKTGNIVRKKTVIRHKPKLSKKKNKDILI